MKFEPFGLVGAWLLHVEPVPDERGFFARTWSQEEFSSRGLSAVPVQSSLSFNRRAATLRGMHYQVAPREEAKIIRCVHGAIYDVLVDLRRDSATFGQWRACQLTADNRLSLYAPEGVANGFLTLTDDAEVLYLTSAPYDASLARGVRWNDPAFGIAWPFTPVIMAERDRAYPDFVP